MQLEIPELLSACDVLAFAIGGKNAVLDTPAEVLPVVMPVQPVRSLPLNSSTGLPFTQDPSSCSLITGARSPVKDHGFWA
jgi:hypothetical protein